MCQVTQERNNFGGRVCHFGCNGHLCIVLETQEFGFFFTQLQNFFDERTVVEGSKLIAGLVRSTGDISAVQLMAQVAAFGELHDWQIARHFEGQFVTIFAFLFGGCTCCIDYIIWNAF